MQALDRFPETWCKNCGHMTAHDGWAVDMESRMVDIFCDDCGKKKESITLDDAPKALYDEIVELVDDRAP